MLRLTCVIGQDEPIYLHAFGGRPPEPGKLCEGENKVTKGKFQNFENVIYIFEKRRFIGEMRRDGIN